MDAPAATAASIAADEFTRRRTAAQRKVAQRELTATAATAALLPWLAIACRAGADLPDYADRLNDLRAADRLDLAEHQLRWLVAHDICAPRAAIQALHDAAAVAIARDAAAPSVDRHSRARALQDLARHFGITPTPLSLSAFRKAAA